MSGFLIVYADAYEWVELPNVSGMILFADGGYSASKPYAAGGSYMNKCLIIAKIVAIRGRLLPSCNSSIKVEKQLTSFTP